MCWEDGRLRFFDTGTESYLRSHDEERAGRLAAQARVGTSEARAENAEARVEEERAGRVAAESRLEELEAERRRLRG